MINNNHKLLTRKEAAEFLGVSEGTLAVWKVTKRYPLPVIKVGRLVKYRESDLINFLDAMTDPQIRQ
jgi:excisionase family DNA binding protein